jgi:hypothetical protein
VTTYSLTKRSKGTCLVAALTTGAGLICRAWDVHTSLVAAGLL